MTRKVHYGGSFAPPLDEAKLASFDTIADSQGGPVGDAMKRLITMLKKFWETPRSPLPGSGHPSGAGMIIPLEDAEIERIWDHVPWMNAEQRIAKGKIGDDDCDQYGVLFGTLPQGEVRNAAFHLLWYARELAADREPITNDLL